MFDLLWLIPVLPLVGVAINALFGRRMSLKAVGAVACGVVLLALLLSVASVWQLSGLPEDARHAETVVSTWMPLGPWANGETFEVAWGFALDPLSALMILVVTGVGFLIHVYSVGYMEHETDYARFFIYMNLFMAMMLTLVLGNNLLVMFVGWEGVGLCSYLLIGFFYDKPFDSRTGTSCADAGRKAFITNRIGDFAFLIAMLYLALHVGTLNFTGINEAVGSGHALSGPLLMGIGLLMFLGACGKSAQIPLYVWLPDAMAGPTPVSALIHAATMVTAGVYMVCRMSALYVHAPEAMAVVAAVGALTAIFAATMGLTATDIKKVLAYSTVSQLGYMFAAAGVGAYTAAMFHLTTHAFFKALLFLGAGSVIHALHGEQDIRKMGGLRKKTPATYRTFLIAAIAISGIIPFAGFFSKDEILWGAWSSHSRLIWLVLLLGAVITAFYMFRLVSMVFFGEFRGGAETWSKVHESTRWMTVPLMILAALSIVGGWINIPKVMTFGKDLTFLHHWLAPSLASAHGEEAHGSAAVEVGLMILALALAAVGIFAALRVYRDLSVAERLAKRFGVLYHLVRNLYWVDELYEYMVLQPFYVTSRFLSGFDKWVVDGLVNAAGIVTDVFGQILKLFQTGYVRNYALVFLMGVLLILVYLASV